MGNFLSTTPPDMFAPKAEISICYCIWNHRFLFIRRSNSSSEGGLWTAPSGKLEKGESPLHAAQRELFEETGLKPSLGDIHPIGSYFARKGSFDMRIHLFYVIWEKLPTEIALSEREHDCFEWINVNKVLSHPLMFGADECYRAAIHELKRKYGNFNLS